MIKVIKGKINHYIVCTHLYPPFFYSISLAFSCFSIILEKNAAGLSTASYYEGLY